MGNKKLFLVLFSTFCLGLLSQNLFAQSNNLAKLYFVKVKSGQGAEFAAALKEHVEWRKQAGDPWTWIVHQVVNGGLLKELSLQRVRHFQMKSIKAPIT